MSRRIASADFQQRVAARFAASAASYDAHSDVQRHAASTLAGLIATASLPPRPRVLEIGCGTGHLTTLLATHLPGAHILATDIAPAMVATCRARLPALDFVVMDGTQPTVAGSFHLVCANLAAQWFVDLPAALDRLTRLLAPGGVLALSLLGEGTFREWREAHTRLSLKNGTLPFRSTDDCRAAFPAGGALHLYREIWIDRPTDGLNFLKSLRALGADTPVSGHQPLSPTNLYRVLRELGKSPAITYELIFANWRNTETR